MTQFTASQQLIPRVKAALVDMDGTLLDSMPSHARAWQRMTSELGMPTTVDEFFLYEGMTGAETIDMLMRRHFGRGATPAERVELYRRKTSYFNEMPRVAVMPGALQVLEALRARGVCCVLVTGSGQGSTLGRIDREFPAIFLPGMRVTSADVARCKPHPEPYIKAMQLARVAPHEAIVIENAPLGVEAGHASGAFTIGVTTGPVPAQALSIAGADRVAPSMTHLAQIIENEWPI